jgi:hypothetical protein
MFCRNIIGYVPYLGYRWPPTAVGSFRCKPKSHKSCGLNGIAVGFIAVFQFPLPLLIPPTPTCLLIFLSPTLCNLTADSIVK